MIISISIAGYRLTVLPGIAGLCIPLPFGLCWLWMIGPQGLAYGLWRMI